MRRLIVPVALACLVRTSPATAGSQGVSIASFSFTPSSLVVNPGVTVTFTNTANVSHTATSDAGFFNTGTIIAGSSSTAAFPSAGSFPYHCQIHPVMHGLIRVPVTLSATGSVPKGTKITIHFASESVDGRTYDLQRRIGTGPWVTVASGLSGISKKLTLKKKGHYAFRAEVSLAGAVSGWSPAAKIRVTAA